MTDNLFPFLYWALGQGHGLGRWPQPGADLVTGGSPRYQIYRTSDDRYIAAAPLEEKFWQNFCDLIELPLELRNADASPSAAIQEISARIGAKTAEKWNDLFASREVCCSVVLTLEEAVQTPHFVERGIFERALAINGTEFPRFRRRS